MSDFDFARNGDGNYQANIGNSGSRVTIQTFADKIYVDIRDYFAKDSSFIPTRRGVTLTKTEWQQLCFHATQVGNALMKIQTDLANGQQPDVPAEFFITNELKQSIRVLESAAPSPAARVVITKTKTMENPSKPKEISLKPIQWCNLVSRNRERINMLIDMLESEASLSANKRKQDALAAERALFQATWSLPTLQDEQLE